MQQVLEKAAHKITARQKKEFSEKGFVRVSGLLTDHDLEKLRTAMDCAVRTFGSSPNYYNVTKAADSFWDKSVANDDNSSTQHDLKHLARAVQSSQLPRLLDKQGAAKSRGNFFLDTSVWRRVPELADFALRGSIPGVAAALLGVPRIRFHDDQVFIKEPGAVDRVAFHQDIPYLNLDGYAGCIAWVPLERVTAKGGRIGYIPGSHLWNKVFKPNIFVSQMPFPGSEGLDMPCIDDQGAEYKIEYVEMEPGDVLIHHFLTVHGSEGNTSSRPRPAFSLRYCDASIRFRNRPGAPSQPLHRQDMKDGDALDDSIHPIVWPANDNAIAAVA